MTTGELCGDKRIQIRENLDDSLSFSTRRIAYVHTFLTIKQEHMENAILVLEFEIYIQRLILVDFLTIATGLLDLSNGQPLVLAIRITPELLIPNELPFDTLIIIMDEEFIVRSITSISQQHIPIAALAYILIGSMSQKIIIRLDIETENLRTRSAQLLALSQRDTCPEQAYGF